MASRSPDRVTNNLPTQLTPFIGRQPELAQLHALLADTRLLTVTGSGGCGKTRLALQAAVDRIVGYADGLWYLELAPLSETSSVVAALAEVLHVQASVEEPLVDRLVTRLRDDRALIVIDNCEHLLDDTAALVDALLRGCPPLQVLTTSRQPLNLPGEVTWRVPSLSAPRAHDVTDLASLGSFDAVRLFVDRAVRSRPNFAVTNDSAAHVAAICEQLDGIPLAIELAAARVRTLRSSGSPKVSTTASGCCAAAAPGSSPDSRPCSPRWSGATTCSTTASALSFGASPGSAVGSRWARLRRSPASIRSTSTTCSICSRTWSTARSSCSTTKVPTLGTGCSRPSSSLPGLGSKRPTRSRRSSIVTLTSSPGSLND